MGNRELDDILNILQKDKPYLEDNFGLLLIGIFGSCAKGDFKPDSDIDFLAGLHIYLEERLGRPVELIRKRKGLSERFLKSIEKDIHYV